MLKKFAVFFILFSFIHTVSGQSGEGYYVKGIVKDKSEKEPIEMATVQLLAPDDSTSIAGTSSDPDGNFKIQASEGEYLLKISFVSFEPVFIENIQLTEDDPGFSAGTIYLKSEMKSLSTTVVEGEISRMTMEGGKKIFNVGQDLNNANVNAIEVLENIPAVTTDLEGNLSLRGSDGVRVLINGKPASMMGVSGSEALQYYPANRIKKVEVITNPSAKYEAQGSAGIINIILNDNEQWGLNGVFTAETGIPQNHGASVDLNYRKKWYNIFASYNINTRRSPGGGWREQTFNYPDTTYSLKTTMDNSRGGINHNIRLGSDFYFTPNDVLKVSAIYSRGNEENESEITYKEYSGGNFNSDEMTQRSIRDELEEETEGDYELNLNYTKTFGKEDHELTADLQARNNIEIEDANLTETRYYPGQPTDTSLFQSSLNDSKVNAYLGKIDYTWPFSKDGKFSTGFRGEYRTIENKYYVDQRKSANEPWERLSRFSNTFLYHEEIYGVYAMYKNKWHNISYEGGLRIEYTGITTGLETENEDNNRSYFNFFPSLAFTYHLSKVNSLQLSYSRRINRPYFRQLNPFNTFRDNRNYRTGNPDLHPEFTGAYDLGYVKNQDKSTFYAGAFYRRTINDIEGVDTVNNKGVTVSKPYNLASRDNFGLEVRYGRSILDWWDFDVSSFFYRGETTGNAANEDLNATTYTMDARISTNIDVKDWFEIQINADYRAPEKEGQDIERAMYDINAGIRKDLFNDKGRIVFSVRDIFNTHFYQSKTIGNYFTAEQKHQWRQGPFFSLSFSYELKHQESKKESETIFESGNEDPF
ncbi:MAG: TonB-dependent receptor family protein [Bacteroidales bacterium]|nr:TonB-dependent receptor family protein [Bacteroidales bacterium]MCF8326863.1 TonB-dependent receptor family protein [Bacteroidales bacterium]